MISLAISLRSFGFAQDGRLRAVIWKPQPVTLNPQPVTPNPQPVTPNPQPVTPNPQPVISNECEISRDPSSLRSVGMTDLGRYAGMTVVGRYAGMAGLGCSVGMTGLTLSVGITGFNLGQHIQTLSEAMQALCDQSGPAYGFVIFRLREHLFERKRVVRTLKISNPWDRSQRGCMVLPTPNNEIPSHCVLLG